MPSKQNTFGARAKLGEHFIYRLDKLAKTNVALQLDQLPFSIKILLESLLRNEDGYLVTADDITRLAAWNSHTPIPTELPFLPARVVSTFFIRVIKFCDLVTYTLVSE